MEWELRPSRTGAAAGDETLSAQCSKRVQKDLLEEPFTFSSPSEILNEF